MQSNSKKDWLQHEDVKKVAKKFEISIEEILRANSYNKNLQFQGNKPSLITLSSSQEIANLIEEIVRIVSFDNTEKGTPLIYDIYHTNQRVQSMCKEAINPKMISKQDTSWLLKMEGEVYKKIEQKDLNLYDLSFKMAVSERQLHRKIKNLIHLTPNKYIRVLKLHKAKQLIDDYLYDTISQISYAVGYYDTHYFSKLFNQQYGIFPKELLKNRG